jgi:hypothetical protein
LYFVQFSCLTGPYTVTKLSVSFVFVLNFTGEHHHMHARWRCSEAETLISRDRKMTLPAHRLPASLA